MDKDNIVSINDDNISLLNNFINEGDGRIIATVDNTNENYQGLKHNGIYNTQNIEKGLVNIKIKMQNTLSVMNSYYDNISNINNDGIAFIDEISIPKTFSLDEVYAASKTENITVDKTDGTSVNNGVVAGAQAELDTNSKIEKEEIQDISNKDVSTTEYDDSSIIKNEKLSDISNSSENDIKQLDEYKYTEASNLTNIDNNNETEQVSIDDNTSINNSEEIYNMNNNSDTEKDELDDIDKDRVEEEIIYENKNE